MASRQGRQKQRKRPSVGRPSVRRPSVRRHESAGGRIRIIGGRWKTRQLIVPDAPGLRPTGDRVRETLFNWLQQDVAGARCLDLFAGTGILGLEALSRFAASVVFVDSNRTVADRLAAVCQQFEIETVCESDAVLLNPHSPGETQRDQCRAMIVQANAEDFLATNTRRFEIAFLDPPFEMENQWSMLQQLVPDHLANSALIYVESKAAQQAPDSWPERCELIRHKRFGDVQVHLLRYTNHPAA